MKIAAQDLLAWLIFLALLLGTVSYIDASERKPDTGLLLAKSIWGECGIDCFDTDEGIMVYQVYKKIEDKSKYTLHEVICMYSGAVKKRKNHPNPWVHHLNREGRKPKKWDNAASWKKHRGRWIKLLAICDVLVANGSVYDPCPECVDYCGRFEKHIARKDRVLMKITLKNLFFREKVYK